MDVHMWHLRTKYMRALGAWARSGTYIHHTQAPILLSRGTHERDTELAVSREEAQHANFVRARAVPRCLWSVYVL